MIFSILQDNFLKHLTIVSERSVDGSLAKNNPIYNNVLMELTEDGLHMTVSDGISDIKTFIPKDNIYSINELGKITVNAKNLASICKLEILNKSDKKKEDIIEFKTDDSIGQMLVKRGKGNYKLSTMDANEYPKLPEITCKTSFKIKEGELKDIIKTTSFSMGTDDVREIFNAILFDIKNQTLNAVATDSHRLAYNKFELYDNAPDSIENSAIIVGRNSIKEINRLIDNNDNLITVEIGDKNFSISTDSFIFTSKLIDGTWPKYLGLFPNPNSYLGNFIINKDALKNLIDNINVLTSENDNWVNIIVENGKITLRSSNKIHETAEVSSNEIIYDGEYNEMTLNHIFLKQILSSVSVTNVRLNMTKTQLIIEPILENNSKEELKFIIMLVKK